MWTAAAWRVTLPAFRITDNSTKKNRDGPDSLSADDCLASGWKLGYQSHLRKAELPKASEKYRDLRHVQFNHASSPHKVQI